MTSPMASSVNMSTGTQGELTLNSLGTGGVYRLEASGRGAAGGPPLGVTRPPFSLRLGGGVVGMASDLTRHDPPTRPD